MLAVKRRPNTNVFWEIRNSSESYAQHKANDLSVTRLRVDILKQAKQAKQEKPEKQAKQAKQARQAEQAKQAREAEQARQVGQAEQAERSPQISDYLKSAPGGQTCAHKNNMFLCVDGAVVFVLSTPGHNTWNLLIVISAPPVGPKIC